jgi:hypothetical protein
LEVGPTTINLLRVVNQVYKSPYDPVAMKNFFSRLKDIKDMLENVIQVSVRYNKGTGLRKKQKYLLSCSPAKLQETHTKPLFSNRRRECE